ncbi:hypothetical protein ACFL1A_01535, partial [Patescibacteria group bacterium]
MKIFYNQIKKQPLVFILFLFLTISLFLGDGKQPFVDVVSLSGILALFVFSKFYLKKQQEPNFIIVRTWIIFILYLLIRTVFSDDIGYSIYTAGRYLQAFLTFYIFASYHSKETQKVFLKALLGFGTVALIASVLFTTIPGLNKFLP